MSDWKLHTPKGVNDILPAECTQKKEIQDTIWSVFAAFGYKEVETPTFEYYDCFSGVDGQISQEGMFKFFDEQGRILTLRPDITTSIARMAATKQGETKRPLRFCYTGNVYRADRTEGVRQREFTQSGIELIGSYSPDADAEVIAAAIEAALACGIEELHMEIGQVAFFAGLTEQAGLNSADIEKIRERIDSKDTTGIKAIIKDLDIAEDVKSLMIELPYLFGGLEVLEKADVSGLNEKSKTALSNIRRIYELLCLYGLEDYVSIDLGMLQSIDYYTGSIFKCYTHGVGFPICAGGRYDTLMEKFGEKEGAVGVAFGINRLISALGKKEQKEIEGSLVYPEKNAEGIAYDIAYTLRQYGIMVEQYINGGNIEDAEKYARELGRDSVIRVFPDAKVQVMEFSNDEIVETTAEDFINFYGEEEHDHDHGECDCGHHHEHGESCDCGHHHEHGEDCDCGHCH